MADLKVIPTKTARFTQLVQRAGKPSVHLSFAPPAKDPELQKLLKQDRVMSVHRGGRAGGADFGVVGLREEKGSQIWVFPKSLRAFTNRRIVGINYDLLDQDFSLGMDPKAEAKSKAWAAKEVKRKAKEAREAKKQFAAEKKKRKSEQENAGDRRPDEPRISSHRGKTPHPRDEEHEGETSAPPLTSPPRDALEPEDIVIHLRSIQRNLTRGRTQQATDAISDLITQLEA